MKSKEQSINEALERELLPIKALERVEDVCIHVVDSTGKIVCYSKGCEKIENMKHEDVIGKNTAELYDYVENESMQDYVLKTGKKVRDIHVKYKSPSGKLADVISSTYPVFSFDDEKTVDAAICIYRDISDYIHMAQTIDKLQMDLKNKQLRDNGTQFTFKDVVGSSIVTVESVRQGKIAAQTSAPILIAGPTGTGKEVFAQSIHNDSNRANYPFVAINCSAIPENLLESTLFGTVKGSFTGALDSKGLLESAKGGTLFFDEINSMNMTLQSKLLRVLETKRFRKVGGNKEIDMDVRILSALNQDPLKAIDEKRLRSDLYYRLAVFSINLPSLMERKSDIPELVSSFLSSEAVPMGKSLFSLSDNARDILLSHDWPGNIRELKHAITHAIYMAQYQDTILTSELLPAYLKKNLIEKKLTDKYLSSTETNQNLKSTLGYIEKQILCDVLNTNDYNISKSARELGISRQNLQYKIKLYHIECNT
ncbi:MAG: sigma 54-interacting transcriptional regulator [Eubacterium sp.]